MVLTLKHIADKVNEVTKCDIRKISRNSNIVKARIIYSKLSLILLDCGSKYVSEEINKSQSSILIYYNKSKTEYFFTEEMENIYNELKSYFIDNYIIEQFKSLKKINSERTVLKNKRKEDLKDYVKPFLNGKITTVEIAKKFKVHKSTISNQIMELINETFTTYKTIEDMEIDKLLKSYKLTDFKDETKTIGDWATMTKEQKLKYK